MRLHRKQQQRAAAAEDGSDLTDLTSSLPEASSLAGFRLQPIEMEKDDDTNHHMDFITAASNLRATNYGISPADKHQTKGIAGKIISCHCLPRCPCHRLGQFGAVQVAR